MNIIPNYCAFISLRTKDLKLTTKSTISVLTNEAMAAFLVSFGGCYSIQYEGFKDFYTEVKTVYIKH